MQLLDNVSLDGTLVYTVRDLTGFSLTVKVIGYSIIDVNRTLQQNSEPVTKQQNEHINQQVQDSERKVTGAQTLAEFPCNTGCSTRKNDDGS